jgi:hypothetical protein
MALQSGIESFIVVNYLSNLCETIWKWDENYRIATRYGPVRVVCLGSIEQKVDDYLATNISEEIMNNEEIAAT